MVSATKKNKLGYWGGECWRTHALFKMEWSGKASLGRGHQGLGTVKELSRSRPKGRAFQVERTASMKFLKQERSWRDWGKAGRPVFWNGQRRRLVGGGTEESGGPGPGSPVTMARSLDFTCERKLKRRSGWLGLCSEKICPAVVLWPDGRRARVEAGGLGPLWQANRRDYGGSSAVGET